MLGACLLPGDLWLQNEKFVAAPERKAIFFDLDGTVWQDLGPGSILRVALDDCLNLSLIKQIPTDYIRIAVSNQTFFARCKRINVWHILRYRYRLWQLMKSGVFDAVAICHHHPDSHLKYFRMSCGSRKPHPGLFLTTLKKLKLNAVNCMAVGDRITDIAAAKSSGIDECFLISNDQSFQLNVSDSTPNIVLGFKAILDLPQLLNYLEKDNGHKK
jgi:D-glycero-D-manno-heptose 1,7-bisphosphate phosphatase